MASMSCWYWCNQAGKWFYRIEYKDVRIESGPWDTKTETLQRMKSDVDTVYAALVPWWRKLWNKFVGV